MRTDVVAGVFVGGRGARMGGRAKGLMRAPDGATIVDRWRRILGSLGVPTVLVGAHPEYAGVPLEVVEDNPPGIGPLGGLVALLRRAGRGRALAVAGDMPFVSCELVERLLAAEEAGIVAPRRRGRWEPLCAIYGAPVVLPLAQARAASGRLSLQGLLDDAKAVELQLSAAEADEMHDWDTPGDMASRG